MSEQDVSTVVEQDPPLVPEADEVESPRQGSAAVESPNVESPEVESSKVETLDVASPKVESPTVESPTMESSADAAGVQRAPGATGEAELTPSRRAAALVREGEVAADFLEQLLDIADMDGDIDVDVDGDRAAVAIVDSEEGRVSRRLVGTDGKVLEALQELTRLAVQSATGERSRLMLDVAGHRAERRAALVTIAQGVIAIVKSTGEKQPMQPMTAFERKVVHDAVLASGLGSESEGVEPHRFVVILPA
jgi:spoIIIJ-associated protein